jgi:hypothetical protein
LCFTYQAGALKQEESELEQTLRILQNKCIMDAGSEWFWHRIGPTKITLLDLSMGVRSQHHCRYLNQWAMLSVAGSYQHMWRLRERRDTLVEGNQFTVRHDRDHDGLYGLNTY